MSHTRPLSPPRTALAAIAALIVLMLPIAPAASAADLTPQGTSADPDAFVTRWDTRLGPQPTVTFALTGAVDVTIDWGDGTTNEAHTSGQQTHTYTDEGEYTVAITGTLSGFAVDGANAQRAKLVSVDQWGDPGFTSLDSAFHWAVNLTSLPADGSGTGDVTTMRRMFRYATSLQTVPLFDTSSVTSMAAMFEYASSLETVPPFDTANVADMMAMFRGAGTLTTLPQFDTSNVTEMGSMFTDATSFNADLSGWCVPLIASEPSSFYNGTAWTLPGPQWGTTCPTTPDPDEDPTPDPDEDPTPDPDEDPMPDPDDESDADAEDAADEALTPESRVDCDELAGGTDAACVITGLNPHAKTAWVVAQLNPVLFDREIDIDEDGAATFGFAVPDDANGSIRITVNGEQLGVFATSTAVAPTDADGTGNEDDTIEVTPIAGTDEPSDAATTEVLPRTGGDPGSLTGGGLALLIAGLLMLGMRRSPRTVVDETS